jgi:hypothetical protein
MRRTTDPQLDALIVNCATETTVDIRLRGAAEPYRYSTRRKLFLERGEYTPLITLTRDQILTGDAEQNHMTIELDNVDDVWGEKVASALRPLELADVSIRRYYESLEDPLVYRHEPFFGGKLVGPEANEEKVSFDVILKTTAAGISVATKTLSPIKVPGTVSQSPPGSPGNPTSGGGTVGGGTGTIENLPCFIAGTRVLTPRGWQSIEKVKKGWRVFSFNENTRQVITDTVVETFRHVVTGFYNLRFSDGTFLRVTGEHKFLTASGEWKPVFRLRYGASGDRIWHFADRRWTTKRVLGIGRSHPGIYEVFNFHVLRNQNYLAEGYAAHNREKEPDYRQHIPI